MTSDDIQKKIIDKVEECINQLELEFTKDSQPSINFKLHGKTAGKAYLNNMELRFNLKYAEQNLECFLNDTVPHEVAHLAEWYIYRTVGHKARWKNFMNRLGIPNPKRCHSYKQDSKCI